MTERLALLLYWRIPHGRKLVRGYTYDSRGVVDVHLRGGWVLTRWGRRSWALERPQRIEAAS